MTWHPSAFGSVASAAVAASIAAAAAVPSLPPCRLPS